MKVIGVIPARIDSTRLHRKLIQKIGNKAIIEHVVDNALNSNLEDVIVITDSPEIYNLVNEKCKCLFSNEKHDNGTSRIAEFVAMYEADYVLNLQGDEPFISPSIINEIIKKIDSKYSIYSLMTIIDEKEVTNQNNVKVVCNVNDEALYFSRSVIPFARNEFNEYYKHIGLYIYSKSFLSNLITLLPSTIANAESLEQLKFLYNGYKIKMLKIDYYPIGIDTMEDLIAAREYYEYSNS